MEESQTDQTCRHTVDDKDQEQGASQSKDGETMQKV